MTALLRPCLVLLGLLSALTGLVYPLVVTGLAQALFPRQANGSLVVRDGHPIGSALIGQPFDEDRYFWGRPSATAPVPYNAAASAGSNLGPGNPALREAIAGRLQRLHRADPGNQAPVPVDLVTSSASGLDPHISPAAARYQAARVARVRGIPLAEVQALVDQHTDGRQFGILGEATVNVLALNRALDARPRR